MKYLYALAFLMLPWVALADSVVPIDEVENNVNIRMSPDSASEIVGKLDQGSSVALVNSIAGWHEVRLEGGATGFISADWTKVVSDAERVTAVDAEEAVEAPEPVAEEAVEEVVEQVVVEAVEESVAEVAAEVAEESVELLAEAEPEQVAEPLAPAPVEEPTPQPDMPVAPATPLNLKGDKNYLVRFRNETTGSNSQIYDDGNQVGIGTTTPKQRLEVNGSIQIHEQNSSVAGLMITQSSGDTGYIMHNRANTLTIGAGSVDRMTIDREGNVGIGVARPKYPLEMASGAHVSTGGVWTNSSSRQRKENILSLSLQDATTTLMELEPVVFNYKNETDEDYVGFIAEDVPELVAVGDRDSLSTMDIVAVLTRVVQEQQNKIKELEARLDAM